jgi:AsmA protein
MKVVKYLLLGAIGIVVLVVIAVVVLVATFDPNRYKPELARVVKEKTGRTLAIDGNIGLSFFPSIGVAVGKASLSEPGSSRTFASIDQARISLALLPLLSKQVVVDRVTLSGLNVELVQHKDGKTNFGDLAGAGGRAKPEAKPAPRQEAVSLDIAGVDIRSSTVGWRDEASGSRYKASVAEFTTGRIASGVPGKLALSARVEATQPKTDLQVKLSSGYRLDLEKQSFAFSGIDLKISDGAPGSTAPATSLKGDLEFDASPQALRFNLAADRLNLDRYLPPPSKAGASGSAGAPAAASGAEQPIDLSALKGLNLKGSLKVGELVVSNVKTEKVDIGLRAEGGKVDVSPLAASLYQGSFSGAASVNANSDRFALKGKLAGVAVGPLLHDALNNDLLEGRGDVTLDVQTGGTTVSAMKKALAGGAGFSLRDAALKGINLEEAIRKARALAGSKAAAEQGANRGERTDFTELSASFVIKNGVAHNEDLSAKSPLLRISGSGDVNIGANSIDYLAKASVVGTATGQGGKELASVRGITVPVKITGALEAPKFRVDLATTAREAVKEKAEEKLKERARDRLKGLLRR